MQEIDNFIKLNNIDVLGVSEANLNNSVAEYKYKIEGYNTIKALGPVSRIITYIKEDIVWREIKNYANELSSNWLKIRKVKSRV